MDQARELTLCNARIVTPSGMVRGALHLRKGRIADIGGAVSFAGAGRLDMGGDYLLPGLVELHTDSLERFLTPRPGVLWPKTMAAVLAHDAVLTRCGILTVLDALCAEAFPREEQRRKLFQNSVAAVSKGCEEKLFSARHFLHLRCETCDPAVLELVAPHINSPLVRLVSLMDHTPGQRQYCSLARYREYYSSEGWSDSEFQRVVAERKMLQQRYAAAHRLRIIELSRQRRLPLASHDDASREHVQQALGEGVGICEFPTTLEAAQAASEAGMKVLMGAPNLIVGRSHTGNVSTREVLEAGILDILSSDYAPCSLLEAPFVLQRMGLMLHEAVNMVSATPAAAVGLSDSGRLEPGCRGDVLRVRLLDRGRGEPVVLQFWCEGRGD